MVFQDAFDRDLHLRRRAYQGVPRLGRCGQVPPERVIIDVSSLGITGISSLTFSTNADNDLVINTGEGNGTIVLEGVTDLGTLTDEDFIFADPPPADAIGDSM